LNITLGNVVQLTFYNMGKGTGGSAAGSGYSHPVHIHGTHFYVMKVGYAHFNETNGFVAQPNDDLPCSLNTTDPKCNDLEWTERTWLNGKVAGMNTYDPSYRDTVMLPAGGYIVLRFRADNPGWFFGHCHVMMHNMAGTAFALRIGEHSQMPQPPYNFPRECGIYEQPPLPPYLSLQPSTPKPFGTLFIILIAIGVLICVCSCVICCVGIFFCGWFGVRATNKEPARISYIAEPSQPSPCPTVLTTTSTSSIPLRHVPFQQAPMAPGGYYN
jgi:hypothetical protein